MRAENRKLILLIAAVLAVLAGLLLFEHRGAQTPAPPSGTPLPTAAPTPAVTAARGKLRVEELMLKNAAVLPDEDGDFSDWIELHNVSGETLDLTGWTIADREGREGWALPAVRLPADGRLLLFASGKDRSDGEAHTDFSLSERDTVCLYDAAGTPVDKAACRAAENDVALVRTEDGDWVESLYPTPGFENTPAGYVRWQETLVPAGPLAISEVMVSNFRVYSYGSEDDPDWVEIKNISDADVQLGDYWLSDKDSQRLRWRFPEMTLHPGASLLVLCTDETDPRFGSTPRADFKLDSSHEQLYLCDGEGRLIDFASLRDIPYNCSFGRLDGEAGFFYFSKPTPLSGNRDGLRRVSPSPRSPSSGGVYAEDARPLVEISGVGTLRYTLDGSAPTEKSPEYLAPVEITKTCVFRARSFEADAVPSRCLTLSFVLDKPRDLPVVCLAADVPRDFRSMYDAGAKGFEVPGAVSYFALDGGGFTASCGIAINGETSRTLTKKNMSVRFRGAYGQETVSCDIYGGGVTEFSSLLLRAGQDQYDTVLRNELCAQLALDAETAVISQRSRYCALYVNGEYFGLYALMERCNGAHYAAVAGVSRDSVEAFEADAGYDSEFYRDVVAFARFNDMSVDENYAKFCSLVDIDNLIDWVILEGYFANTDLTSGNLRYARSPEADGKWHLLLYDMDATFRSHASIYSNLLNEWAAQRIQVASFINPLLKNPQFCDRFLSRAASYLSGPLSNEHLIATLDSMAEEIRPELERDFAHYRRDLHNWELNVEKLRNSLIDEDWQQENIEALCKIFQLDEKARAAYFGEIDKPKK